MNDNIERVITCGVRWGALANSYADLMTENGVCILGSGNKNIALFRDTKEGDLFALKDGRNIIALAKPQLDKNKKIIVEENSTWEYFFDEYLEQKLSHDEKKEKASHFGFSLGDEIDIITVEGWVLLDTPIYYPIIQSTVSIKHQEVKQECYRKIQ